MVMVMASGMLAVLLGCGPPPKPATLILLEQARVKPFTRIIQTRDPEGWGESDTYYRRAHQAWQANDMDEAQDYIRLAMIRFRIAEANTKCLLAEERISKASGRIEAARERERYYQEEKERLEQGIKRLTTELSTADLAARQALAMVAKRAREAAQSSTEELVGLREAAQKAGQALKATEEVKAQLYAAGRYNKARNLLGRMDHEIRLGHTKAARATLEEIKEETVAARQEAEPKFEALEARRKAAQQRSRLLDSAQSIPDVEVRDEPRGVVVVVPGLFEKGKQPVMAEGRLLTIDQIGKLMLDFPAIPILLEGHTDSKGPKQARKARSLACAERLRDYLMEHGIDAGRLSVEGYGDTIPFVDKRSAKSQAKNRRAEVIFLLRR